MKISIIIPTYNEHEWLPDTVDHLYVALKKIGKGLQSEVIIVDDGSTDETKATVLTIAERYKDLGLNYEFQTNSGRLEARKTGLRRAKYDYILLIDSRVHIGETSLRYVVKKLQQEKKIWNSHVVIKRGNYLSMFWDVIVRVAWSAYFKEPREVEYGAKDFDKYPKGTTCFFAPKRSLEKAICEYEKTNTATKSSNDDTAILRLMIEHDNFHMSPEFYCFYHSRSSMKKFIKHSYHRGQVFVDGFFAERNRYRQLLYAYYLLVPLIVTTLFVVGSAAIVYLTVGGVVALVGLLLVLIIYYKIYYVDAINFIMVLPLFMLSYGAGLWAGLGQFIQRRT